MGCGHSNILEDDEMAKKIRERKEKFYIYKENYKKLLKCSLTLEERISNLESEEDIKSIIKEEGINIYENEMSRAQGTEALNLLIANRILFRNIITSINLKKYVYNEQLLILESLEEDDDFEIVSEIADKLSLPTGIKKNNSITSSNKLLNNDIIINNNIKTKKKNKRDSVNIYNNNDYNEFNIKTIKTKIKENNKNKNVFDFKDKNASNLNNNNNKHTRIRINSELIPITNEKKLSNASPFNLINNNNNKKDCKNYISYDMPSNKNNSDILTYYAGNHKGPFLEFIVLNLKYEKAFYYPNVFLHLTKSDLQNSQRMIDLGEVIDLNPNINNLLVYLEPILPEDYKHSKSKHGYYTSNCSNLSYFFDAINQSLTLVNLAFISHQRVNMKFTDEALTKFFDIFANVDCKIEALVLINVDFKEKEIHRFESLFKNSKTLKYFVFQPSWPTDYLLSKITDCMLYSKILEFVVFFHGRKCSDEEIDRASSKLMQGLKLKKVFFEDNYYFLINLRKSRVENNINYQVNSC